ncbi:hypothetical protein CKAN_01687200 [Cinnamomum micranthum f. kanehirae]|uniref:Uncharacterized protein n=1 Tax=Cinnamomum micranthum f. kanehirae TaxID=337451 RepID=A0A3S3MX37_9MAGN|nr:hypothetical protein CKAN_01687200 [Cinnamomum micranthum f. kanehirae]
MMGCLVINEGELDGVLCNVVKCLMEEKCDFEKARRALIYVEDFRLKGGLKGRKKKHKQHIKWVPDTARWSQPWFARANHVQGPIGSSQPPKSQFTRANPTLRAVGSSGPNLQAWVYFGNLKWAFHVWRGPDFVVPEEEPEEAAREPQHVGECPRERVNAIECVILVGVHGRCVFLAASFSPPASLPTWLHLSLCVVAQASRLLRVNKWILNKFEDHIQSIQVEAPTGAKRGRREKKNISWTDYSNGYLMDLFIEQVKLGKKDEGGYTIEGWKEIE